MKAPRNNNILFMGLAFVVWPFLSFITSVFHFDNKRGRIFIVLFICLFGLTMITDSAGDSSRYAYRFSMFATYTFSDIVDLFRSLIAFESERYTDLYFSLSSFTVSRFTENVKYSFAFHALVFAIFYVGSLATVRDEFSYDKNYNALFFFLFLVFAYTITKIGFVRFPIATWVFFYGVIKYFKYDRKRYLFFAGLAILIHFSYIFALVPLLILVVGRFRPKIYLVFFCFTLVTPSLMYNNLSQFDAQEEVGEAYGRKLSGYSNLEYKEARKQSLAETAWYKRYRLMLYNYYLYLLMGWIIIFANKSKDDNMQKFLYCFMLLLGGFVTWGGAFESLGQRFAYILSLVVFVYMFRYFYIHEIRKLHWLVYAGAFPFALYVAFDMRQLAQYWNMSLFFGNIPFYIFTDYYYSLLDFIK